MIPAGTPEDQGLQAITKEPDAQKKLAMYEDFLQQFSSNPAAVAYGNWQVSQYYQSTGDLQKALDYGDKALASAPHSLDILVSQASIAQQLKNNSKLLDYAVRGGEVYNSIGKSAKPEGMSDQDFATQAQEQKDAAKNSYEFLEAAAFNVIVDEKDARSAHERHRALHPGLSQFALRRIDHFLRHDVAVRTERHVAGDLLRRKSPGGKSQQPADFAASGRRLR